MTTQPADTPPRSLLFVGGNRPDRFAKAARAGADDIIIDLEDAVAASEKAAARRAAADYLRHSSAWVRTNASGDAELEADLAALDGATGLLGVVVPKAESATGLDRFAGLSNTPPLIALVESAAGLLAAEEVARHHSVCLLAFGNLDFAADCGMDVGQDEQELLPARSHLVVVSRVAGLPGPLDGVTADVRDLEAARRDGLRAARLGFSGKLCVHPDQVPVVAAAFAPTEEQVTWALRVLEAFPEGVGAVDGVMVDRPVILRARHVLERAGVPPAIS